MLKMKFIDIKSFTYIGKIVSIDGVDFEVKTPLGLEFEAVQFHKGRPLLEEPLMTVVEPLKYQYALDEWVEAKRISEIVITPTQAEIDAKTANDLKVSIQKQLDNATVTVDTMVFQADEKSIAFMTASILTSQTTGITENRWKLADNTTPLVTVAQISTAQALAMQQLAVIKDI